MSATSRPVRATGDAEGAASLNVGVVGAGAIGSYYAGVLARAGHRVTILARGAHLESIRTTGLEVRAPDGTFTARPIATHDPDAISASEYVIVAVKGYSLEAVAPVVAAAALRGAVVVPLLNGVDVAERFEALGVPAGSLIGGLATVSVARTSAGVVERRSPFDRVVVGERDGRDSSRVQCLVAALRRAGVEARGSSEIRMDLWRKFAFIVPITVACGLGRTPMGDVLATNLGRQLIGGSLAEIVAVSRAGGGGPALSDADERRVLQDLFALAPAMKPSFLLDLERGGPTEVDLLSGTVSRLGVERGVPTPIHTVATAAFTIATRMHSLEKEP